MRSFTRLSSSLARITQQISQEKRELILSILKSTTTKREAKAYLQKYRNDLDTRWEPFADKSSHRAFGSVKYNASIEHTSRELAKPIEDFRHIALIRLPADILEEETLRGISLSIKNLIQLGVWPLIVLEPGAVIANTARDSHRRILNLAHRVANVFGRISDSTNVDFSIYHSVFDISKLDGLKTIDINNLLDPILHSTVPLILPIGCNIATCELSVVDTNECVKQIALEIFRSERSLSLEKVVFVDHMGGVPSIERRSSSHVFINMTQEYSDIVSELHIGYLDPVQRDHHLLNLSYMKDILEFARDHGKFDVTGLITTPRVLALEKSQLNPLAYNVLTDRPIVSSSLPVGNRAVPLLSTNVLKLGFDVKEHHCEHYPEGEKLDVLFKLGVIERQRFVDLMNDAFGKDLDEVSYFRRLNSKLASVIIIGDYDGGAVITNEGIDDTTRVSYLDKFAISKKNQGLPSMADVIFKVIVQSHSHELFWRSRKSNPINKWYFERSQGSMSTSSSPWKIFYTGELYKERISQSTSSGIDIKERLETYQQIVDQIPPSF